MLARKATRSAKQKFHERLDRKKTRLEKQGKTLPVYWHKGTSKDGHTTFSGSKALQSTATYPVRFCNAIYRAWADARAQALLKDI